MSECPICNKRLKLTALSCKCGRTFCNIHRLPETHNCTFDYKETGKLQITKNNPKIESKKIIKI